MRGGRTARRRTKESAVLSTLPPRLQCRSAGEKKKALRSPNTRASMRRTRGERRGEGGQGGESRSSEETRKKRRSPTSPDFSEESALSPRGGPWSKGRGAPPSRPGRGVRPLSRRSLSSTGEEEIDQGLGRAPLQHHARSSPPQPQPRPCSPPHQPFCFLLCSALPGPSCAAGGRSGSCAPVAFPWWREWGEASPHGRLRAGTTEVLLLSRPFAPRGGGCVVVTGRAGGTVLSPPAGVCAAGGKSAGSPARHQAEGQRPFARPARTALSCRSLDARSLLSFRAGLPSASLSLPHCATREPRGLSLGRALLSSRSPSACYRTTCSPVIRTRALF
ncbi:hypothetical protein MRX96_041017 [Rhipicephalus microplus]